MFQSPKKLSLKNKVHEKYLVFFADLLTLKNTLYEIVEGN